MKRLKARHRSFGYFEAPVEKAKAEKPEKAGSKLGGFGAQDEEDVTSCIVKACIYEIGAFPYLTQPMGQPLNF